MGLFTPRSCDGCLGATRSIPSLFTQGLVLPPTPLSWKHTKRAGVHSFSGGMYTLPPLRVYLVVWGECVMYPPDFACTLARFVCLYFVRLGEYFEVYWQGFSEIVLQIPLETAIFAERILRKERERPDLSSLTPEYRSRAGVSLRVHACKGVHRAVHVLYAWSVQACTRSRRIRAPLPLSATLQAKRRVSVLLCPWSNAHDSGIPSRRTLRSHIRPLTCTSYESCPRRSASCATSRPCCDPEAACRHGVSPCPPFYLPPSWPSPPFRENVTDI